MRAGRLRKAEQFLEAAGVVRDLAVEEADVADACITLLVHAGIAAADAICCAALGRHAQGDNHHEAVELLRTAEASMAKHLNGLLGLKTRSGYGHAAAGADDLKRATRAAAALVEHARRVAV